MRSVSANGFYYGLWSMVDCYKGQGQSQKERGSHLCVTVCAESLRTNMSYFLAKKIFFKKK